MFPDSLHVHSMETSTPIPGARQPRKDELVTPEPPLREAYQALPRAGGGRSTGTDSVFYRGVVAESPRLDRTLVAARSRQRLRSDSGDLINFERDMFREGIFETDGGRAMDHSGGRPQGSPPQRPRWADPAIPFTILLYVQLVFNTVMAVAICHLLWVVVRTMRQDIADKMEMYTSDAVQEISRCLKEYFRNRCGAAGGARPPALEQTCLAWERCMNRDPEKLGRLRISAETVADIVNGFVRPLSWKALVLLPALVVGGLVFVNVGFLAYRAGYAGPLSRQG